MIATVDFRPQGFLGRFRPAAKDPVVTLNGVSYTGTEARGVLDQVTRGKRGVFIIHGYNSPDSGVDEAYAELVSRMSSAGLYNQFLDEAPYHFILLVKWPGGWKPGYTFAEWRAYGWWPIAGAGDRLHDVLIKLECEALDGQAHSLGNGVMLDANRKGDLPIRHMILAAAAVDYDCICSGHKYMQAVSTLKGNAMVFHSKNDGALEAYRLCNFDEHWKPALGYCGPPVPPKEIPSTVRLVDANAWSTSHGAFRDRDEFYDNWLSLDSHAHKEKPPA